MAGIRLQFQLNGLPKSIDYADLKITCQGAQYNVHRAVVCPQCPVFAAAMRHDFQEKLSGVIDLPEDEPQLVAAMLEFMYTGKLDSEVNFSAMNASPCRPRTALRWPEDESINLVNILLMNLQLYVLADKYDVPNLRHAIENLFLRANPSNLVHRDLALVTAAAFDVAQEHHKLRGVVGQMIALRYMTIKRFRNALSCVMEPEALKEVAVAVMRWMTELSDRETNTGFYIDNISRLLHRNFGWDSVASPVKREDR